MTADARDRGASPARRPDGGDREGRLAGAAQAPGNHARRPRSAAEQRRARLRPTVEAFPGGDGHLYLLAGEERHLRIRNATSAQRAIIAGLTGPPAVALAKRLRSQGHRVSVEDVLAVIADLEAAGLIEDADDDARHGIGLADLERFDRQLRYLGDMAPGRPRAALQRRLLDAHVAILGLGGLGSWALQALACVGIGRFTLVDFDRVELSNLNRQSIYRHQDVGRLKVECAHEWLAGFAPHTSVTTRACRLTGPDVIAELVRGADLVLGLVDSPVGQIEGWINAASRAEGIATLGAGQFPPLVRVGPLYEPDAPGCHACLLARVRSQFPLFDELASWRRRRPTPAATFGPASALVGALLANEAVNLLTGICSPVTRRQSVTIDLRSLAMQCETVVPLEDCDVCRAPASSAARAATGE